MEYDTDKCRLPCTCTPFCTGICPGRGKNRRPCRDSRRAGGCGLEFRAGFPVLVRFASFDALHGSGQELVSKKHVSPTFTLCGSQDVACWRCPLNHGDSGRGASKGSGSCGPAPVWCLRSRRLVRVSCKRKGKGLCARDATIVGGCGRLPG